MRLRCESAMQVLLQAAGESDAAAVQAKAAAESILHGSFDFHAPDLLGTLLDAYAEQADTALSRAELSAIIDAFETRPEYARPAARRAGYARARARLELSDNNLAAACPHLFDLQERKPSIATDLGIAVLLEDYGHIADARLFLDAAEAKLEAGDARGLRFPLSWYATQIERLSSKLAARNTEGSFK